MALRPGPRRERVLSRPHEVNETTVEASVPWRVRDAALLVALGFGVLAISVIGAQGLYLLQGAQRAIPAQAPAGLATTAIDLFYLATLAGIWLFVVRRYRARWSTLGLRLPRSGALGTLLFLGLALASGTIVVLYGLSWALDTVGIPARLTLMSDLPARSDPLFAVSMAGSLALAPVCEELLFRGVLYQAVRQRFGPWRGILASAVMYALLHLQPVMIPEMLLLGVVMALAFEQTRSLYPCMVLHVAYNGVIILMSLHGA